MAANTAGTWGSLLSWPVIAIHSVVTQDGKVLTFGTDINGRQGGTMYHDVWDPVTGTHHTLDHAILTPTDIFCANAIIVPGTSQILITGGDARPLGSTNTGVADVNLFDTATHQIVTDSLGKMAYARWYATAISLPNGEILVMGGTDFEGKFVATPELYTPGVGWKTLTGATDISSAAYYDRAFVRSDGKVVYVGTENNPAVMLLDPAGDGSVTRIGTLPFVHLWDSPAIQFAPGKVLINDWTTGLWTMDFEAETPTFVKVGELAEGERNFGNMTVLADGKVLINGGSTTPSVDATALKTAHIWDPATNELTDVPPEAVPRLYHSTSVLLPDGTVLSAGGGAVGGPLLANQQNAQIYKPAYLFDADGNEAVRPLILDAPDHVKVGATFTLTVENAGDIAKLTFVRNAATTHDFNVSAGAMSLEFTVIDDTTLSVAMPDLQGGAVPGSWMLFAWNKAGVPSIAPVIAVDPVFAGAAIDGADLLVNGSFESAAQFAGSGVVTALPGWQSSNANFELWKSGVAGANATDGSYAIEIDASRGLISQTVETGAGHSYELSFDFTGNPAALASSKMAVLWNGEMVATVEPANAATTHMTFMVTGTGGKDKLAFHAVEGDTDAIGGFLDNVKLKALPGSTIAINAAGATGAETMALVIDGVEVARFDNVPASGGVFTYEAVGVVSASQVRVAFINDLYDPTNGVDRNLTVAGIEIDGKSFATADPSVYATGVWTADGYRPGYDLGTTLHGNGFFQYADATGPRSGSVVTIDARGATGQEQMALVIDGVQVALFDDIPVGGGVYTFRAVGTVTADQVRVSFTNDLYDPAHGIDRNLTVSGITIDGTSFASDDTRVLSTGVWTQNGFQTGFGMGDTLHGNGSFQYAYEAGPHDGSIISIDARGATGQEQMALLIDGVQVAQFSAVAAAGSVYTYQADGHVTAGQVRIVFNNDFYDPAHGIDRNLTVTKITIDGTSFSSTDPSVHASGVWTGTGFQSGHGLGDTIHGVGYLQFADPPQHEPPPHTSLLTNGSFETLTATLTNGHGFVGSAGAAGWSATGNIEVWQDGASGQPGADGRNAVEIDAANGTLSQAVHTTAGEVYGLTFHLAGRTGFVASSKVEVLWNGQVVATATPTDTEFHKYHVNVTGTGHDVLSFRSAGGDADDVGGLLDNVILHDHAVS